MIRAFLLMIIYVFSLPDNSLLGRWESVSKTGAVTGVVFKADRDFEVFVNRKAFTSGKYRVQGDTLIFSDTGCGGSEGMYRNLFYHNGDSLRWTLIYDTCTERARGMQALRLGRKK